MSNDAEGCFWGTVLLLFALSVAGIIGSFVGEDREGAKWQKRLVKSGYAHWQTDTEGKVKFIYHEKPEATDEPRND